MQRLSQIASACLFLGLMMTGCGGGDSSTPTASAPDAKAPAPAGTVASSTPIPTPTPFAKRADAAKPLKLAFVTNNASDFWTIAKAGCTKAADELGKVDVQFRIPSDGNVATQKQQVDDLLVAKIDGIAISVIDPANETPMLNEVAKKTLLITQDSDAGLSDRVCYIGTDNHAAGLMAGDALKEALPNGGKVMVFVGNLGAQNAQDRLQGIKDQIKGTKIEIIDVKTDDADTVRAKSNAVDTIVKYPDVACLVGLYAYNGPAILGAVKDSGKTGKIKIVCFDEDRETLQGIKDGAIEATVVQQPFEFGRQAIAFMAKYLDGDKTIVPASKKNIVPTKRIDKKNVADFEASLIAITGRK